MLSLEFRRLNHSILISTRSSACRKFDRSGLRNSDGPPPIPSMPARSSPVIARVAQRVAQ